MVVYLTQKELRELKKIANHQGRPLSNLVRVFILEAIADYGKLGRRVLKV